MPNKPSAADFVAKKSDSDSPGPQNDFARIIGLSGLLQHYHDGARRWSDARQVKYEAIRADRNRQISADELRRAVAMFDVAEKTMHSEVEWLEEFHHLIVMHKLISLVPSLEESRITHNPPHEIEAFDWQAFRRELLAVRDEATRLRFAKLTALDSDKTPDGEQQPPNAPKIYLSSWRELLDALGKDNNTTEQRHVRAAHKKFPGPIIMPTHGGQPTVVKTDLLVWWNGLEDRYREEATVRDSLLADRSATLENQFDLGRGEHTETVVPDIAGRVKRRRGST